MTLFTQTILPAKGKRRREKENTDGGIGRTNNEYSRESQSIKDEVKRR